MIADWAPSGDLLLRERSGELARNELEDGDGLAPLRYSNAPDGVSCSETPCDIPLRTGAASIQIESDGATVVQVTDGLSRITLTWPESVRAVGITILSGRTGLYEVAAPARGNRPRRAFGQS